MEISPASGKRGQSHLSSRSPTGGDRDEGLTTEMQVVETQSKSLCTDMTTKEEKSAGEVMKMREKDEHSEQESASINKSVQHQYFQSLTSQGVSLKCQDPEGDPPHDQHPKVEHFLGQPVQYELEDRDRLSVLTWNLDGLDSEDLLRRAGGLFSNIKKYRPDVLLLQELVPEYLHCLKKHFVNYTFLQGSDEDYFSGIMLRKSRVQLLHSNIVKFRTTSMGRNLLLAYVSFFGRELCVMTSHLESYKTNYQERQVQLKKVWTRMREVPKNVSVIFGGDTNLRDKEVSRLGGLPEGICDVWEALGEPEDCRYTWDTETNDNKDIPHSVRLRFDRVFMQAARDGPAVTPESMELIGQERLSCGYFTSDHWGILCAFTVGPEVPTNKSSCKRRRNKRREQMGINGGESHSETMSCQVLDGDNVKKGLSLQGESSQSLDSGAETPQDPGQQTECFLGHPVQCELEEKDKLTVLTWNLDGHDQELKRLGGLFSNIKKYRPEIILLQEFKTPYLRFLMIHFKNYHILTRHFSSYFTCIMLRKSRVQLLSYKTVKLPSKTMQRDLLMAHVKFCGRELYVMTSHLIYGKENSQERLDQIGKVWTQIREAPDNVAVIFGGDTNLRDWEVNKLGGPPEGISDVWEALGKPEDCRYTWDMETNDNKDIPKTIRMRWDRIFTRASTDGAAVVPKNMALIGQERLNCGLFASDHWGVLCDFTVKPQDTPHESTCKRPPEANVKEEEKKEGDEMKKNEEEPRSMSNHDKPSKQPSKAARMAISIGNLFKEHVEDKDKLTVLSWSLDGLCEGAERRCGGLFRSIDKYQPDIILLQEVIPLYLEVLDTYFWNYEILPGSDDASSTCIMLKKYRVRLLRSDVVNYPTTEMNRNLLMAYVNFYGRELCVMTSHLESGKENSQERMNQLRRVWKRMREAPDDVTVIFGGDTNLTDEEVSELGGLPKSISDVWEILGKPEDCRYTWDTTTNDSKRTAEPTRLRFDRIFLRPAGDGAPLTPESVALAGLDRLRCGSFTSSHWGVLCGFSVGSRGVSDQSDGDQSSFGGPAGAEGGLTTEMPGVEVNRPPQGQQTDRVKVEKKKVGEEMKMEENQTLEIKSSHKQKSCKLTQYEAPLGESPQDPTQHRKALPVQSFQEEVENKKRLTVLTWNLQGQDKDIRQSSQGLSSNIQKYDPDVVLLQELTPPYLTVLKQHFGNYEFLQGSDRFSFTCIMLRKNRVELLRSEVVNYPTTEMRRNLLMAYVNFYGRELCVMTSHLESGKENSQERMNQLRRVWKRMREAPDDVTVIFGGDTNLRDWEVIKLGGAPVGILDVWETLGKPEDCSYTWISTGRDDRNPVRIRFDRVFLRPPGDGAALVPEKMSLAVLGRPQCRAFGSTHWGVLCDFAVSP